MGASPKWKVYDAGNNYVASVRDVDGASLLMDFYGDGSTIRLDHRRIVWTEGKDGKASESYDETAIKIQERLMS
jgi:hypothetical protein